MNISVRKIEATKAKGFIRVEFNTAKTKQIVTHVSNITLTNEEGRTHINLAGLDCGFLMESGTFEDAIQALADAQ